MVKAQETIAFNLIIFKSGSDEKSSNSHIERQFLNGH